MKTKSQQGRASRSRGQRGERLWRDQLRDAGFTAERGRQHHGRDDAPDVVCPSLPTIHFEVKFVEKLNINNAIKQAIEDANKKTPVVAHKKANAPWLVTMLASDWLDIIKESEIVK